MRTIETTVYTFSELSDEAKEKALENNACTAELFWSNEYLDSIKKACEYFDIELKYYSIDWSNSNLCSFKISEHENSELSGVRLFKYLINRYKANEILDNCEFTGFCADCDFMDEIKKFLKKPCKHTNLQELLESCVESVISAGCKDYEYQLSEEGFAGHCEANGYEFTEEGKLV